MPLFSAKVRKVMELLHRSMYNHLCFRSETIISTAPIFATVYTLICVGLRSYLRWPTLLSALAYTLICVGLHSYKCYRMHLYVYKLPCLNIKKKREMTTTNTSIHTSILDIYIPFCCFNSHTHVGCDCISTMSTSQELLFQLTHPCRV